MMAALINNQQHPKAMSEWVGDHAEYLRQHLWPHLPSESTLLRALRLVDVVELESRLRQRAETKVCPPTVDYKRGLWMGKRFGVQGDIANRRKWSTRVE